MKLTELDPRWTAVEPDRHGQGLVFLCPKCKDHYLGVYFSNPVDGKPPYSRGGQVSIWWERHGDKFETLSITPSIQVIGCCAWHGHVTNGEILTS